MTTWGEVRNVLRVAMLEDVLPQGETDESVLRWSDEQLLMYWSMAENAFCSHTAKPAIYTEQDFTGSIFNLPSDVYDDPERTAQVIVYDDTRESPKFLNAIRHTKGLNPRSAGLNWYLTGLKEITFTEEITDASDVELRYFAKYVHPVEDTDVLEIPEWAETPLMYLTCSHAMSGYSMRSAQIRQWAVSPERGGPEDNPFRVQHKWFRQVYEEEVYRVKKQDRENAYRSF